ncbi:MAG: tRNA lysidine(34) synthetase TilS [Rikenellaceae bacterium]
MLNSFESYLSTRHLATKNDKILLAVSGGVDSMVMYDLFYKGGYDIALAHCNFSLRGEEADGESEMVRRIAAERGTEFHFVRFDTLGAMRDGGKSMQETARALRYEWFDRLAKDGGYTKIAIAHNINDSVETFFINSIRGCGVRGLTGITISRNNIIRPISFLSRYEIEAYAQREGVEYRNDSSNNSIKYLRNKIRHLILPKILEIAPTYLSVMSENMERVSEAVSFIDSAIEKMRQEVIRKEDDLLVVSLSKIDKGSLNFVTYELLKEFGFNSSTVSDIVRCYNNSDTARWFNSHTNRGYLQGDEFLIEITRGGGVSFLVEKMPRVDVKSLNVGTETALLDYDKLTLPITIRTWRDGDSFVPFGMKGRKKVGDYMSDTKKNIFERDRQMVAECLVKGKSEIVWVVGERPSDLTKIDNDTKTILKITKLKNDEKDSCFITVG